MEKALSGAAHMVTPPLCDLFYLMGRGGEIDWGRASGEREGRRPPRLRRGKRASPVSAAHGAAGPAALSCGEQQPAEEKGRQRSPCGMQGDAVVQKPQQRQCSQHAEYRVDGTDQAAEAE